MAWRPLLDFLFPSQCANCNALGSALCSACAPRCGTIGLRLPGLRVTALAPYEQSLRTAVLALKDGRRDVAEILGRMLAPIVPRGACLVPIPTTAKRRRIRGMDGVALVAAHAAMSAGGRVVHALEHRSGDSQRGRSRDQRLAARGRFHCKRRAIAGERVILVDDVCTTGATLRDCAAAIREAGGIVDDALVVAVALHEAVTLEPATKSARSWRKRLPI
jgi:predicted amidophosphoribosyltransferase